MRPSFLGAALSETSARGSGVSYTGPERRRVPRADLCRHCGGESSVVDTKHPIRRRECKECKRRWNTTEVLTPEQNPISGADNPSDTLQNVASLKT